MKKLKIYLTLILTLVTLNSYTINFDGKANHHFVGLMYDSNYPNKYILVESGRKGPSFFYKERKISDTLFIVEGLSIKLFTVEQKIICEGNKSFEKSKDYDVYDLFHNDYFYYLKPLKDIQINNVEFINVNKNSFGDYSDYAVFKYSKKNKIVVGYKEKSKEIMKYCYNNRTILKGQLSIDSINYYQFEELEDSINIICMKKLGQIIRLGWFGVC